jgi:hypothetical protein
MGASLSAGRLSLAAHTHADATNNQHHMHFPLTLITTTWLTPLLQLSD